MKIKFGFVTNSSSSSFIVAWDKEVKTFEDVKKRMSFATTKQIETVFDDIQNQEPLILISGNFDFDFNSVLKRITNEVSNIVESGYFPGRDNTRTQESWDLLDKRNSTAALELTNQFIKEAKGKVIYQFRFSDEDGDFWSDMEHGNLFRNLQHLTISHH